MAIRTYVWIIAVAGLCGFWVLQGSRTYAALNSQDDQAAKKARVAADMKKGEDADAKQDYATSTAAYHDAIILDPSDADTHKHYVDAVMNQASAVLDKVRTNPDYSKLEHGQLHGQAKKTLDAAVKRAVAESKAINDSLLKSYDDWIAAHPQTAAVYWGKGYVLDSMEKTDSEEELFQKALSLDPKLVPAYNSMAQLEFARGDYARQKQYLKQVMDLDPNNADAAQAYAESFQFDDPVEFRKLAQQYATRFPNDNNCPYMLYQLENTEPTAEDRVSVLESMRRDYVDRPFSTVGMEEPGVFSGWLEDTMVDLFNLYAKDNPQKALDLAQEMQKREWADPDWKLAVEYQQNFLNASGLIAEGKYSEALALLQKTYSSYLVTNRIDHTQANLAAASALAGSGKVQEAFDALAADWIKSPNPELKGGLDKYGAKLEKSSAQIDDSLWQKWTANAKPMKSFELKSLDKTRKVKLSDFHGRVILVSFWFPLCSPCRGEMPYLNLVAKKFQPKGFEILAINGLPEQDNLAPGVLKNYDISGLLVPSKVWAKKYDNIQMYPTNFLLDGQGHILAHPYARNQEEMKMLETRIDAILAHTASN